MTNEYAEIIYAHICCVLVNAMKQRRLSTVATANSPPTDRRTKDILLNEQ
jgi:hypothetical protein